MDIVSYTSEILIYSIAAIDLHFLVLVFGIIIRNRMEYSRLKIGVLAIQGVPWA
jgi:hypothetical protein